MQRIYIIVFYIILNFSIPTLVYYLTVTVLFLFFTVQELEKRRWN